MKRVYLILTLFMTSFFFYSSGVRADVITYGVSSADIELINDTFFELKQKAEALLTEDYPYFVISYGDYYGTTLYKLYTFKDSPYIDLYKSRATFRIPSYRVYTYQSDNLGSPTSSQYYSIGLMQEGKTDIIYSNLIYSSYENIIYSGSTSFNINYNGTIYPINKDSVFPTLYDLYSSGTQDDNPPEEDNPKLETITSFYTLVIDKIKLLTNYIATDYIILSALVIFIFVAVIGLVRRLK